MEQIAQKNLARTPFTQLANLTGQPAMSLAAAPDKRWSAGRCAGDGSQGKRGPALSTGGRAGAIGNLAGYKEKPVMGYLIKRLIKKGQTLDNTEKEAAIRLPLPQHNTIILYGVVCAGMLKVEAP